MNQEPPVLSLNNICKSYARGQAVMHNLCLEVAAGELLSLLGPSGCGKTTTLRLVAGLERPEGGEVWIGGENATDWAPARRGVGMVFQDYALFPHLSVWQNVAYGLPKRERAAAMPWLELVGLGEMADRMPQQLSGGQQQRVALARALAARPRLLLLDEPFSNLDAALRQETRAEVRDLLRREGISALLVTHDQEEAMAFSDRVAIMRGGVIEQIGTPHHLYTLPRNEFVARFLGQANLLRPASPLNGGPCACCLRPEGLQLSVSSESDDGPRGVVEEREFLGPLVMYRVRVGEQRLSSLRFSSEPLYAVGQEVSLQIAGPLQPLEA